MAEEWTVPYVVRDEQMIWHQYQLPTAWTDKPVYVQLYICLQPGEVLDCQMVIDALRLALRPAPPVEMWKATTFRYAREAPTNTANKTGREFRIGTIVSILEKRAGTDKGLPDMWGRLEDGGWVYLGAWKKV